MNQSTKRISRRDMIKGSALLSASLAAGLSVPASSLASASAKHEAKERKGRIKQLLVSWTYMYFAENWTLDELCQAAVNLGIDGIELVGPAEWPTMQRYGLVCGMSVNGMPDPPYEKGLNNPFYRDEVIQQTKKRIEECAEANVPNVIAFTGFKYRNLNNRNEGIIPTDEGAENTIAGLKELALHAERHNVTVCLEHLNSRFEGDDFRGHPGYQGDDIDYCADIIRSVGSSHVKLLFDVYHVQIMNGDIIARIKEYGTDLIGHIHTAGVPNRSEIDSKQEINYPPIMEALLEIGYEGYVGHEFIATRDPMEGLREAVDLCDV
ncbi:MAG: twin-arginine translocation signal domain-containing protein [Balneolaceae bacterium]|nr:MAG: twin-arginine translocation signal domain-containing protein [Balneolaceae bacterium]